MKSDKFIADRVLWHAKQHGCPYDTVKLFDDLVDSLKSSITGPCSNTELGKPVLFFEGENNTWTVLCSKGMIFKSNEQVDSIKYSDISDHTIGDDPFNVFDDYHDKKREDFVKVEQHQILLKNKDKQVLIINAKKGSDVYTLYNILLMLLRMSGVED